MFHIYNFCYCILLGGWMSLTISSPQVRPKTHTVEIKDMKFVPAVISVNKGDIVVWVNKDIVTHDITEQKGKSWKSPPISMGKSWKKAISEKFDYYCSLHPVMKGKVELK